MARFLVLVQPGRAAPVTTPSRVRLDQRGFGDSDRPEQGYGIDALAEDTVAFLDALSIDRATIVGHSFGSFVTRRVAITHPERVARMVLIGTGLPAAAPVPCPCPGVA